MYDVHVRMSVEKISASGSLTTYRMYSFSDRTDATTFKANVLKDNPKLELYPITNNSSWLIT